MVLRQRIILRVMALVTILIAAITASYVVFMFHHHRAHLTAETANRVLVASDQIGRLMLWDDRVAVRRTLYGLTTSFGTTYAFVERDGKPYIHTFSSGVPRALLERRPPPGERSHIWDFEDETGRRFYDIAYQVRGIEATLHVGLSRAAADRGVYPLLLPVGALIAVLLAIGLALAIVIARWTTREVDSMTVSRDYLQTVIDAFPHALYAITPNHEVVLANRMGQHMAGEACVLGRPCFEVSHHRTTPCEGDDHPCPLQQVLDERSPVTLEHRHYDAGGQEVPFEVVAAPILVNGEVIGIIESAQDVSEKARLEQLLRQAQKMEAIGQLAGGVAHDFNNLLQVIQGYVDMAIEETGPETSVREELQEVSKACVRAAGLIRQLLAFSRQQVLELTYLDLNQVVNELARMIRRLIGEHITLDVIQGENLGLVHADRGQFEQILMNLCVNARDAMPNGGSLTIETRNIVFDQPYCETHQWACPGPYVLTSVTDSGCGMDQETLNHVFEPFFTTKAPGQGTGLGLATVFGIVRQHRGIVQVYSEAGRGTTFKIYFPIVQSEARTEEVQPEPPASGGHETILIAEDAEPVRQLAKTVLEKSGYTVITAEDGNDALRVFTANQGHIDLLLLDVVMPGLSGREVFERVREKEPTIPVVFSSGYSAGTIHTNFIVEQGTHLIQKPYAANALLRGIRQALDQPQQKTPASPRQD